MEQNNYDDIINLPHPISEKHPRMSQANRAAQFAPFAALTGHDAAIQETARLTDERYILDETVQAELDERLRYLIDHKEESPNAKFTYFLPDKKKSGGAYVTETGSIRKADQYENTITLDSETVIPIGDIYSIEGDMFWPDL